MLDASEITNLLGLAKSPVAIAFLDAPPHGLKAHNQGAQPASCSFWKLAQEGEGFYTGQAEHYGCAVGSHTHSIPLPEARAGELKDTIGFMVKAGYVREAEIPLISTLPRSPKFIAYAPVARAKFVPDVVVVAAPPAQAMLLYEAALRADACGLAADVLGRPACAVLAYTVKGGKAALSFGCKGNRTFTGLGDDEMYVTIPGAKWADVTAALQAITAANAKMAVHYEAKLPHA
jgi:uncharacterized protein (DUF169 family)